MLGINNAYIGVWFITTVAWILIYAYYYYAYAYDCRDIIDGKWVAVDDFMDDAGISNMSVQINTKAKTGSIVVHVIDTNKDGQQDEYQVVNCKFKYKWKSIIKLNKPVFIKQRCVCNWTGTDVYDKDSYMSYSDGMLTIGCEKKIYCVLRRC